MSDPAIRRATTASSTDGLRVELGVWLIRAHSVRPAAPPPAQEAPRRRRRKKRKQA